MKKELVELILNNCDIAVISLDHEVLEKFFWKKENTFLFCNTDYFNVQVNGEADNYRFFYENVFAIRVLE